LNEVYLEYQALTFAKFKIGQFKIPFSPSYLESSSRLKFIDRPLAVTNLSSEFDIGAQLSGELFKGYLDYSLGIFNGEGPNKKEIDNNKDFIGRLVINPLQYFENTFLSGLHFGTSIAYSKSGQDFGSNEFKTAEGNNFFMRSDSSLILDKHRNMVFDIEWKIDKASLRSEYISRKSYLIDENETVSLNDFGYYIDFTFFITGEHQESKSSTWTGTPLNAMDRSWGNLELVMRYELFELAENKLFLNQEGAKQVREISGGLNWYPIVPLKLALNYQRINFSDEIIIAQKKYKNSGFFKVRVQYEF